MMTNISYEVLWETSEQLYKNDPANISAIVTELIAKLAIYKTIDLNTDLPSDEKKKAKDYLMGKIISKLTHLSLKDNVNTYVVLKEAINTHRVEQLETTLKK